MSSYSKTMLRALRFFTAVKREFVVFWIVAPCSVMLQPWRWRQHGPPKRWYPTTTVMLLTLWRLNNIWIVKF